MSQSTQRIPRHLAMIMDGNGRWAERRGAPRSVGHRAGAETVRRMVSFAAESGVEILSLYAFSSDNWKRPGPEVDLLMRLFESHLRSEGKRLLAEGIRLEIIGRRDRLSPRLLRAIVRAESMTAGGTRLRLRIAIDYSSRHDIATRFAAPGLPRLSEDVDLLIRTGGEQRLSDFLLWECAYAELAFLPTMWPDLTTEDVRRVFDDFAGRERRFGALPGRATA